MPMSRQLEERIAAAAAEQHGVVTHRQLMAAGLSRSAVARRLQSGRMRALHRGVYLASPVLMTHTREMAAVLATGPGSVVSHLSAAVLWGLRPAGGADVPIEVTVAASRGPRRGMCIHKVRRLEPDERTLLDGIPVTTPARTLVDLAPALGRRELEGVLARAEREGLVGREALTALLARFRRRAGIPGLAALLAIPGGPALTRSAAEARLLALIREAELPPPECKVTIGRYEVDFLWRAPAVAVEVDGFRYHSSRPSFEGDRRKDAQLVADGIMVLRLSWSQITRAPVATAVRLGQALARREGQLRSARTRPD